MWTFSQRGKISVPGNAVSWPAYAGAGVCKNDPNSQHVKNKGPIPRGKYTILAPVASHGGFALPLKPDPANKMHGRSAFMIHGDSVSEPGTASEGCIIVPRWVRWAVWGSGDRELLVTE